MFRVAMIELHNELQLPLVPGIDDLYSKPQLPSDISPSNGEKFAMLCIAWGHARLNLH
jgi:hypothetical protein